MCTTGSKGSSTVSEPIRFKHNNHYRLSFYIQTAAYAIPRVMRERGVLYKCYLGSTVNMCIFLLHVIAPLTEFTCHDKVAVSSDVCVLMYEMWIGCNLKQSSWLSADTLRLLWCVCVREGTWRVQLVTYSQLGTHHT